jgi:ferredoxin/flavodoxin
VEVKMDLQIFIMFSSPAGSTRKVAEALKEGFNRRKVKAALLDIARADCHSDFFKALEISGDHTCLFVGSPVYRDVAVPAIMDAIEKLPQMDRAFAVPFVTWGQACSGVALWQMGSALKKKGFKTAGAAKVLAEHSMMWQTDNPAGKGHPDQSDLHTVNELVGTLFHRFESNDIPDLSIDILDYQPPIRAEQMKKKISAPWKIVPKDVDPDLCTQCGICQEECPVGAVNLNPFPQFDRNCFDCFNCIRLCPEDAIKPTVSMSQIKEHIRERVRTLGEREQPYTQIFL